METIKKRVTGLSVFLIFLFVMVLGGCDPTTNYNGPYVDLSTEAINSLFGVSILFEARIIVVVEDSFGRIMYIYDNNSSMANNTVYDGQHAFAFLVCQKTDDQYVYYYPDYNFIVRKLPDAIPGYLKNDEFLEKTLATLSEKEIEALKEKNDWNRPINENRCVKIKLTREKRDASENLVSQSVMQEVYDKMCTNKDTRMAIFFNYLTSDGYGRHIFF